MCRRLRKARTRISDARILSYMPVLEHRSQPCAAQFPQQGQLSHPLLLPHRQKLQANYFKPRLLNEREEFTAPSLYNPVALKSLLCQPLSLERISANTD